MSNSKNLHWTLIIFFKWNMNRTWWTKHGTYSAEVSMMKIAFQEFHSQLKRKIQNKKSEKNFFLCDNLREKLFKSFLFELKFEKISSLRVLHELFRRELTLLWTLACFEHFFHVKCIYFTSAILFKWFYQHFSASNNILIGMIFFKFHLFGQTSKKKKKNSTKEEEREKWNSSNKIVKMCWVRWKIFWLELKTIRKWILLRFVSACVSFVLSICCHWTFRFV